MNIGILLLFCSILGSVLPFDIEDPGVDGVTFGEKTSTAQIIYVDEKNEGGTVNIVKITGVNGELTINVNSNNKDILNVQTGTADPVSGDIYLSVNLLDYETLISGSIGTNFPVDVIEGTDIANRKTLSININNLDDESPTLSTSACSMKENTAVDVQSSTCSFTVSDPDGWLDSMDFSGIVGTNGESDLFDFAYKDIPSNASQESEVFLVLKSGKELDYETTLLYTFHIEAKDEYGHPTSPLASVPVILQVEDMPDQPPRWDSGFKSATTIPEKQKTTINVSATDGDIGINNDINYEITVSTLDGAVTVDKETGVITVEPINRDEGNDQVVFTIKAYEVEEPTSLIEGTITLIVEDVDDNKAVITADAAVEKKIDITVDENTVDLNLNIVANDIDLGENAIYNVILSFPGDVDYSTGFTIIPSRGYEQTNLSLTILDPKKLNYEDQDWRVITMELQTIGTKTTTNKDTLSITITLNDINDELPVFNKQEYSATVPENIKADTLIATIQATDADQEDIDAGLNHTLVGSLANRILTIEALGGDITTKIDNAFDYEKQSEVIVQILAVDKNNHPATAQLTITVTDINDENPRMVVSSSITVAENQASGFVLDTQISASDEDESSDLEFSIDWANSYATKNSQRLKQDVFNTIQCIDVKTVPDPENSKTVTAELSIKETQPDNTPNFEVFDNLYIQLVVTDKNTEEGDGTDSALIVISIQDLNDNAPVFPDDTETMKRQVTENAAAETVITSPVATDDDVGTQLEYSIESANEDTPLDWVIIDNSTGIITVKEANKIDCDDPKRDNLKYKVTVTDGDHTTTATITVDILDANDNVPTMADISQSIEETPNGDTSANEKEIVVLKPEDMDRDVDFYTVSCIFASGVDIEVTRRFKIDNNTIKVLLADGVDLDRETQAQFTFQLNCYDNPNRQGGGISNTISPYPKVTINLTDINDNPPSIKSEDTDLAGYNENTKEETSITLHGYDDDEENNPNSEITFLEITKIQRFINKGDETAQDDPPQDLFLIETGENNEGTLTVNADTLENYYGYLVLTISLTDKGDPPQTNEVDVTIEVAKYNFEEPKFFVPFDGQTFYLQTVQTPNAQLVMFDGSSGMDNFNATDQQGGKFLIKFKIVEGNDTVFNVANLGNSQGQLQVITDTFDRKAYTLTISAYIPNDDGSIPGSAAFAKNITITIDFFDQKNTDPIFSDNEGSVDFIENENGQTFQLPKAAYSKPDLPDDLPVYYLIREGDASLFELDSTSGLLTLKQELDFEKVKSYDLLIQSSNAAVIKTDAIEATKFSLTVGVTDANDCPPVFEQKNYVATLLTISNMDSKEVRTVTATDQDTTSQNQLTYSITKTTISDPSLENMKNAFDIDSSGKITAKFTSSQEYKGYLTLEVTVEDEAPEHNSDTTEVKIYLVTKDNVVTFQFENNQTFVSSLKDEISQVLDENFKNSSYSSTVQEPTDNDGTITSTPVYFINTGSNAPVETSEIYKKVTDTNVFRALRDAFTMIGLRLVSFASETTDTANMEETLKAWLIGVSVVLGALCLILLIAFILKTRVLNQRINKLSNTKFGSQESGLNRTGVAAPTTNKHAVEGSNPVYNNEVDTKDIDRRSVTSGDSDLIGVEDDDKFNYDDSMNTENVME